MRLPILSEEAFKCLDRLARVTARVIARVLARGSLHVSQLAVTTRDNIRANFNDN